MPKTGTAKLRKTLQYIEELVKNIKNDAALFGG
jgi:hypothetical protein